MASGGIARSWGSCAKGRGRQGAVMVSAVGIVLRGPGQSDQAEPATMAPNFRLGRPDLIRRAFRLEWYTAAWMLIEAAVAISSGVEAHSLSLMIAFGADSLIELTSAGVLALAAQC